MRFRVTRASAFHDYENPPCQGAVLSNSNETNRGSVSAQWYVDVGELEDLLRIATTTNEDLILSRNSRALDKEPKDEPTLIIYDGFVE